MPDDVREYDARRRARRSGADSQSTVPAENHHYLDRPNGDRIVTVTDVEGRLLRRIRRLADGREIVLIDNAPR